MTGTELETTAAEGFKTKKVEAIKPTKYSYGLKVNGTVVAKGSSWSDVWKKAKALIRPEVTGEYKSIKDLIVTMLKNDVPVDAISQALLEHFPASAAAKRPTRHISWYRTNYMN